ncbi:MAG: zinc ribbon domain-containing protein [Clostridiaceae bacterium]|nr:zinc ribbon domain-containing protein [Clostridiaceae bacterium]
MSYCVHCGVELADSEKKCPLCGTEVIDPRAGKKKDVLPPFPPHPVRTQQQVSRQSLVGLLTLIFLIPILLCVVCDASINHRIVWSGYVVGAFLQLYVTIAVPLLLSARPSRHNSVLSLSLDFLSLLLLLKYIEWETGGTWFWTFALPVTVLTAAIVIAINLIALRTELSRLAISAIAVICTGVFCLALELLLNFAFHLRSTIAWSSYPLITFLLLGAVMLYIDRNKPLKEKLIQKFFL